MSAWWHDVAGAVRLARRQPLFTALLVGILAIGIGATVAMYSVLNAVVLRPLPYGRPQDLVWLSSVRADGGRGPFSINDVVDLRARETGLESFAAFATWSANLTGAGAAERLQGMRASANAFAVLQSSTLAGRTFRDGDAADGRVVILGHDVWGRRFGADPGIVGRTLRLNDADYTVVGVLPRSFVFPIRDAELAVPIVEADARRVEGDVNFLRLIGRLRPGVSRARAEQALMTAAGELRRLRPDANARKAGIGVTSLHAQIVGDYALTLRLLLAAVTMVLLLACVNLASLLLARTAARQRELSIRVALGVGRRRLIGQLLIESLVPTAAAGGIGLVLAAGASRVLLAVAPASMPRAADVSLDPGVVLFAAAVTVLTGVAVGLGPAIYFSRVDPAEGLRGAGRASSAPRSLAIRRALVGAEVAISLVLAVATTLLAQSLRRAQQVDPGFTPEHVLSMRVSLSRERYVDRASVLAFQRRLEDRLRGLPGVQAVGGANLIPLSGMSATVDVVVDGHAFTPSNVPEAEYRVVSEGFFDAMGIRRLAGRTFTARDSGASVSVAVINKTMADRLWPHEDPVGRHIRVEPGGSIEHVLEVVGVVGDVKQFGLDGRSTMDLYIPFAQLLAPSIVWIRNNQFWMIRTDGDPLALAAQARAALAAADPDVPAAAVRTLEQAIDGSLAARRFNVWLVALFGYAAMALTACGMYAVSAQTVAERTREFGIRSALGASPGNLVGLVLRTDVAAILGGVGVGLVAARGSAGALGALLFDVRATDPGPYAGVALALAAVAAAACLVPASRAGRIDPLRVIRSE